jgi:hypothetical protein
VNKGVYFLLALILPVFAVSAEKQKTAAPPTRIIDAGTIWNLDTSAIPKTMQLKKGGLLLSIPMYPEKLIRIERDVQDVGTTGVKMSAGKQFFRQLLANGKEVFCSSRTLDWMKDGGSIFYGRYDGTFSCLVDQNGDGMLDGEYEVRTQTQSGVPTITHGKDNGYENIEPVPYKVIEPKDFNNPMAMEVRWQGGNGIDNKAYFSIAIRTKDNESTLVTGGLAAPGLVVPGEFEFAGLRISYASSAKKMLDVKFARIFSKPKFLTLGMKVAYRNEN